MLIVSMSNMVAFSCRWGVVASVLGASVALAVVHTAFESFGSKQNDPQQGKREALPQPQQGGERRPGKKIK